MGHRDQAQRRARAGAWLVVLIRAASIPSQPWRCSLDDPPPWKHHESLEPRGIRKVSEFEPWRFGPPVVNETPLSKIEPHPPLWPGDVFPGVARARVASGYPTLGGGIVDLSLMKDFIHRSGTTTFISRMKNVVQARTRQTSFKRIVGLPGFP